MLNSLDSVLDILRMFDFVFRDLQRRFTWRKIDGKGMIVLDILVWKRSFKDFIIRILVTFYFFLHLIR